MAPWKLPWKATIRSRPVYPRARRTAVLVASVPELIKRTCSHDGTRSLIASASFISRGVGAAVRRAVGSRRGERRVTAGWAWPRITAP